MESLLEPVELNRETTQTLDEIRSGADNALYGAASADAEERIHRFVLPLIEGSGLPSVQVIHYRWYLRELARHWRTRTGRDLAFHLELCIRKWRNLGLEPRTLQFLICEAHQRLKGLNLTTKTQSHEEAAAESPTANREPPSVSDAGPAIENRQSSIENGVAPDPQPLTPEVSS
jgi:hypothetical protein